MIANTQTLRQHTRADVVVCARAWLGTPYHHQASLRGIGSDCIGLVRGVWQDLYGIEAEHPPAYTRDWAEANGVESLLAGAERHLVPISITSATAGDVLVFRLRPGVAAKHTAILTGPATFIHAMERAPVAEIALSAWWRRRIAAAFSYPGTII